MPHTIPPPFSPQELRKMQGPKLGDAVPLSSILPPLPHESQPMPKAHPAGHPRKFDQETYNQLTGLDARLLEQINYDCKARAKASKTGARYSTKAEAYYAKILGCCRETISDHICKLKRLGILDVTRRRKVRGMWQTNMYRVRNWTWWRLGALLQSLHKTPSRETKVSHKADRRTDIRPEEDLSGAPVGALLQQILDRWTAKGYPLPTVSSE